MRGDGGEGQAVVEVVRVAGMTVAQRMDAHATEVEGAIENVAADDVALVEKHLTAQIANDSGAWAERDE